VLGACGGGGKSHTGSVAAGNRICATSNAAFAKVFGELFANGDEEPTPQAAAPALSKAVGIADRETNAFADLGTPKVHAAFESASEAGHHAAELAAAGDRSYLAALAATNEAADRAKSIAADAGFKQCADHPQGNS